MQLSIGDTIKDVWRIVDVKCGGMGTAYICSTRGGGYALAPRPEATGSAAQSASWSEPRIVLKSVSTDFYQSGSNADQFQREALINVTLPPHPYIVKTLTVDRLGQAPIIIMDYASGGNLRDRLAGDGVSVGDAVRIFRQVCVAVAFLASAGILHRDLKPENILFDEAGDVRVSDFGLASIQEYAIGLMEFERDGGSQTDEVFIGGTLPYMSPEHFGVAPFTSASDVYSLGAVMYEVLEGRLLFDCDTVPDYRESHLHRKPPHLSLRSGLADVIARCLAKDPADRYADFLQLDAALADVAQREGMDVPPPSRPGRDELEQGLDAQVWMFRGYAYGILGRNEDSLRCYQRAVELDPEAVGAHTNLASALQRLGRDEEALAAYEKEVELHPEVPIVRAVLASHYVRAGRLEDAIAQFETAVKWDPTNLKFKRELSYAYRQTGRPDDAQKMVRAIAAAMAADPETYAAAGWVNEGLHLGLMLDFQSSLDMLDEAVARYPDSIDAWHNRAVTLFCLGRSEEALESARRAVALRSDAAQALFLCGLIALQQGRPSEGVSYWQLLVAQHPDHSFAQLAASATQFAQLVSADEVFSILVNMLDIPSRLYYRE